MDMATSSSSFNCELRIIRAKNLEFLTPAGKLFVRCYLITGDGKKIRLNSREIPSTCHPYWNQSISLECGGTKEISDELRRQKVVFELRWRSTTSILGMIAGSKLLGRTEIGWEEVAESKEMFLEKWVSLRTTTRALVGLKPPALQLSMRIREREEAEMTREIRPICSKKWKECGCKDGSCNARDEEVLAIAAAMELL